MLFLVSLVLYLSTFVHSANVPYSETFEAGADGWTSSAQTGSQVWVLGNPNKAVVKGAHSGTNAMVTASLTAQYENNQVSFLYSPFFDYTTVTYSTIASFYINYQFEAKYDGVNFQMSTDGGKAWNVVGAFGERLWYNYQITSLNADGFGNSSGGAYVNVLHAIPSSANGKMVQFRFQFNSDVSVTGDGLALDDFTIQATPKLTPKCAILVSPNDGILLQTTVVTLNWTRDPTDDPTMPQGYRVYLDTLNPPVAFVDVGTATNFSTLAPASSNVFWSVVPYGFDNITASGCTTRKLITPYEPVVTPPYFTNFNIDAGFFSGYGSFSSWTYGSPTGKLTISACASPPNCWGTNMTGPYNNNENSFLLSPLFNFTGITTPSILSFRLYFSTEQNIDAFNVQYSTDDGRNWVVLGTAFDRLNWYNASSVLNLGGQPAWTANSSAWLTVGHILPVFQAMVHFRIQFEADLSIALDGVLIDDWNITVPGPTTPFCPTLGGVPVQTTNPPLVSWTRNPAEADFLPTSYKVSFAPQGYQGSSPPTVIADGNAINVTGPVLLPGTTYTWTPIPAGYGNAENPGCPSGTLTTPTETIQPMPYFETFDAGEAGWTTGGNFSWSFGVPKKAVIVGTSNAWVTGGLGNTTYLPFENSWLLSPIVDLRNIAGTPMLSFQIWWDTEFRWDGAVLQIAASSGWANLQSPGATNWYTIDNILSLSTPAWSGQGPTGSGKWVTATHPLDGTAGYLIRLRFLFGSDGGIQYDGVAIDDVRITGTFQTSAPVESTTPQVVSTSPRNIVSVLLLMVLAVLLVQ